MSAAAPARGPLAFLLKSQSGQWMVVGMGAVYAFPEQSRQVLLPALKEVGLADLAHRFVGGSATDSNRKTGNNNHNMASPTPIIIHTTNGHGSSDGGMVTTVAKVAIGAGACWVGFIVLSQALPDAVQEMMPVTRSFFGKTSRFLAKSITQVQKVLEERLAALTLKQNDLETKLDGTHATVKDVQTDLGETRADIFKLGDSMERCESTLTNSQRLHSYTSKGVTLLVRCVATMLPSNDRQVNELAQYIQDGEDMSKREARENEQRRLLSSNMRHSTNTVNGLFSPPVSQQQQQQQKQQQQQQQVKKTNYMIRDSHVDDDLCSLEDVHSILGIGPGGVLTAK